MPSDDMPAIKKAHPPAVLDRPEEKVRRLVPSSDDPQLQPKGECPHCFWPVRKVSELRGESGVFLWDSPWGCTNPECRLMFWELPGTRPNVIPFPDDLEHH